MQLMSIWQRDGLDGVRAVPGVLVVHGWLSQGLSGKPRHWEGQLHDISHGDLALRFGEKVVVLCDETDPFEAIELAREVLEAKGFHYWLDEFVPLYRNTQAEEG